MTRDELIDLLTQVANEECRTTNLEDNEGSYAFWRALGVPEELARAANGIMIDSCHGGTARAMLAALDPAVREASRSTVRWPATEPEPGAMFPNLISPAALYLTVSDLLRDPFVRSALEHRDDGIDAIQTIMQEVASGDSVPRRRVDEAKVEFDNLDPKFRIRQRVAELERELAAARAQL